ncbi:MAG: aldehyde ferredoxin oxidoreductase family protein [Thermoproteota archaeon]
MDGLFGRFLDVNLSSGEVSSYQVPDKWVKKYLGGRGLAARILLEELEPGADPLEPENILLWGTGPLQGTGAPGAGRHIVMAKSPKTGGISGSYAGGFFGHELGKSGYDGIIVRGRADSPVYISVEEGEGQVHSAGDLWGEEVADVDHKLKEKHPGSRVCSIGIAGENLVKFSCIINDRNRAAGRPGFGAVMGSKQLKAVVVKGDQEKPLADKDGFQEAKREYAQKLGKVIKWGKYGTSGVVAGLDAMGILPTKNFQQGTFEGSEKITGETMYQNILVERDTCAGCPVRCKRVVNTRFQGEQVEERYGGPEYETLAAFGSLCMNHNLESIALANQKCNAYGLDTISTGNTIAFAMEASQKGLLDCEIEWGDPIAIVELVDKIAHREGIGDLLATGIQQVAQEIDADFDMQVKGQEIPMHEPRGKTALALSYAAGPRGANHMEVIHDTFPHHMPDLPLENGPDRFDLQSKPEYCYLYQNLISFTNSCILCAFTSWTAYFRDSTYVYPDIQQLVEAATGIQMNTEKMLTIGERNLHLLKIHNAREGLTRREDRLPPRFETGLTSGASAHHPIPRTELQEAIDQYYQYMGWNQQGPTAERLQKLDMEEVAQYLPY